MTEFETSWWPEACKGDVAGVVAGFVAGLSLAEIAEAAGCSVSSVQRRRRHPGVRQMIHDARAEQRRQVLGQLGAARSKAILVLADLLDDDQPRVRLAAANLVLSQALRYEVMAEPEPELEHTTGTDPGADRMLLETMGEDAWSLAPALLVADRPVETSGDCDPGTQADHSVASDESYDEPSAAVEASGEELVSDQTVADLASDLVSMFVPDVVIPYDAGSAAADTAADRLRDGDDDGQR